MSVYKGKEALTQHLDIYLDSNLEVLMAFATEARMKRGNWLGISLGYFAKVHRTYARSSKPQTRMNVASLN